jgi:hypothetical protein
MRVFKPGILTARNIAIARTIRMGRRFVLTLLGIILGTYAQAAETDAPACKTAEVNPVTGHVFCIDPLGAEVARPPQADPCKHDRDDADWTYGPSCTESKGS